MLRRQFIKTAAYVPLYNSTIGGISEARSDLIDQRLSELLGLLGQSRGGEWVIRTDEKGDFILMVRR